MKRQTLLKIACFTLLPALLLCSCNKWEDDVNDLKKRIEALEKAQSQVNDNISAMQQLISAFEGAEYITDVSPLVENGTEIGYTIKFKQRAPITLYHGDAPRIGVKQDTDLSWYWTYNDSWLYNSGGSKILATGITPRMKIENGRWLLSMDNGISWSDAGQATGADGQDGTNGTNGQDGASSFITGLEDNEYTYTITFSNGQKLTFSKEKPFVDRVLTSIDIPDPAFREWLLVNFDSSKDGQLQLSEIAYITSLTIPSKNSYYQIYSLEGIQYFQSLDFLDCQDQMITSLNLSNLDNLGTVYCFYNKNLTTITVSNNENLFELSCSSNSILTSLSIINCSKLYDIQAETNQLTSVYLSNLPMLNRLMLSSNQLASLDVSECTKLKDLYCSDNQLTSLTLGKSPYLQSIHCQDNQLVNIDISKCLGVGLLMAINIPTLSKVYVWNGFNTANPPSDFKVDAGVVFEVKP